MPVLVVSKLGSDKLDSSTLTREGMMRGYIVGVSVISLIFGGLLSVTHAGGLFGEGGLIGGDIGNFLDREVEQPITTPFVQSTTIGVTTGVGIVVGGVLGAPLEGAYVGEHVGQTINERAAGKSPPIGRPAVHGASGTPAAKVSFVVTNNAKYAIKIKFFSSNRKVVWPSSNTSFDLKDRLSHDIKIHCDAGEQICYGAYYSDFSQYWGRGLSGVENCSGCCQICSNTYLTVNLVD